MSEQNKRVLQIGMAIGLIGLIAAIYVWYIFGRGKEEAERKIQTDVAAKIEQVDAELAEIRQSDKLQKEIEEKKAYLERASLRLPSTPDAEGFLTALSDMLDKSNANVLSINPQSFEERSTYVEIPWGVDAIAQYVEFGVFLNLVEQNPKSLMRVKTFKVDNDPALPGYHNVDVKIGTFMFNN